MEKLSCVTLFSTVIIRSVRRWTERARNAIAAVEASTDAEVRPVPVDP